MILLPQVAPADQIYLTPTTQPVAESRSTDLALNFAKTLTERLGVRFEEDYTWLGGNTGWQNLEMVTQYLAVLDPLREALVSVGVDREWGGTGTRRIGASPQGATTPTIYFAKGMADLDIGYLRPLAVTGSIGYQLADAAPRPDNLLTGIAVEYSIPYLQSKVRAFDLPDLLRGMTPLVETFVVTPTSNRGSNRPSATFGPGVNYSGEGWEFTIEALVPAGRGAATGLGVAAQFNLSLDYFFPDTIGKPLFSAR
ncbi:MAG TPA: hypothetical protein VNV39_20175 [Stellaceae bacterium]|nr:hypothetical protein [Stellaceae bacterium]